MGIPGKKEKCNWTGLALSGNVGEGSLSQHNVIATTHHNKLAHMKFHFDFLKSEVGNLYLLFDCQEKCGLIKSRRVEKLFTNPVQANI